MVHDMLKKVHEMKNLLNGLLNRLPNDILEHFMRDILTDVLEDRPRGLPEEVLKDLLKDLLRDNQEAFSTLNELHLAPIRNPHRILDVGTGTGIWALEMGKRPLPTLTINTLILARRKVPLRACEPLFSLILPEHSNSDRLSGLILVSSRCLSCELYSMVIPNKVN
jgi:hypothetical protein